MKFLWRLARKNILRNKLRTGVSILAIAISVMVVVFTKGLISGMMDNTLSLYVQYNTGHIKIVNQEYQQKQRLLSLNYPVDGFKGEGLSKMINQLNKVEGVKLAVPRIKFGAMSTTDEEMIKMLGWGVDPVKEKEFTEIDSKITEGRMIKSGQLEMVAGKGLLKKLNKQVGDKVTVLYNTSFNSFKGATLKIVGAVESNLPLLDETVFYLPLDQAQDLLYMSDQATELLLITPSANRAGTVLPRVKEVFQQNSALEKYSVLPWNKADAFLEYMQIAVRIYDVINIFLISLAGVVVINTMVMIVKERTQEIGMMTALGLNSSDILKLFILEGSVMAIVGSFVGAILGGVINKVFSIYGFNYSAALQGMEDIMINPIIHTSFSVDFMIYGFVMGVIVTSITCIIPARRAAHLQPTDALRDM